MEVGQAISQAFLAERLHRISFCPIHEYIKQMIPFLEQRQEVCKRLYQYENKLTEAEKDNYESLIRRCESEISEILGLPSLQQIEN
jgi:hypothetical protein